MLVRIVIGVFLTALCTLGCYLLIIGSVLHLFYADASDPPGMAIGRLLWLMYLATLNLLWGACAAAMLWPGQRSEQFNRVLGYGAIAVSISGAVLIGVAYMGDHGRFYIELAGLVLVSGFVVGFGQAWLSRQAAACQDVRADP